MNRLAFLPLACAVLALGCRQEKPFPFEQKNMGIAVVFPGEPSQGDFPEDTPYGQIHWHNFFYSPPGRLDQSFHVDVGNLPPGTQGGDTVPAALAPFQAFLNLRRVTHDGCGLVQALLPLRLGVGVGGDAAADAEDRPPGGIELDGADGYVELGSGHRRGQAQGSAVDPPSVWFP